MWYGNELIAASCSGDGAYVSVHDCDRTDATQSSSTRATCAKKELITHPKFSVAARTNARHCALLWLCARVRVLHVSRW